MRWRFEARLSLLSKSLLLSSGLTMPAFAEVFQCDHQTAGPVPALICTDQSSASSTHAAWVSLRKMPAWGSHAGLTIVDLCLKPQMSRQGDKLSEPPTLTVFNGAVDDQKIPSPVACKRRYCTDKKRAFAFYLNGFPFPVGWTVVSFKLGVQTQSFSISCDELSDTSHEGSVGDQP